ncbi:leucine-rich repeat domain-containing protein [Nostoc sp. TCL26-01]|uniref:leucine-rich repeat domain-containing protein n=1 Tax=Nostoc sp. TCL26-01 TaxID=2576904 RepID=UPI0015BBE6F9|nr:leucine-rich repeat domain-containing protein [Nostoc sp. TCL26-01]QLE54522.1 leucine-rich repeat domain-containing protein [Nostoc sp. TCL26-01]
MKKVFGLYKRLFCFKPLFFSLAIALLSHTAGCAVPQSKSPPTEASPSYASSPIMTTAIAAQSTPPQSFAQWCERKNSVHAATKHTIDVLLKIAKTNDCKSADTRLRSATLLDLRNNEISDLSPLASLKNLIYLYLGNNEISDLTPLASLSNLSSLSLENNRISDLKPVAGLTKVSAVYLSNNQIRDLRPLTGLSNVYYIMLNNNEISDLQPLASMSGLSTINLEKNRISDVKPLAVLSGSLRELILNDNQITDLRPLAVLHKLEQLHARNNPLSDKTCPIERKATSPKFPAFSICRFD